MKDLETKNRFVELRAVGMSYQQIAKDLSVSKPTLIEWGKELAEQIHNYKTIELEALFEKYLVAKEQRIKLFGKFQEKISSELATRDLSAIPTGKLFELMLKFSLALREEETALFFKGHENTLNDAFLEKETSWPA